MHPSGCWWWVYWVAALLLAATSVQADIQLPDADPYAPIEVDGQRGWQWQQGAMDVWVVQQSVIRQGSMTARADTAVVWVDQQSVARGEASRVSVYLEGHVAIDFARQGSTHMATQQPAQSVRDHTWFGHLLARGNVRLLARDMMRDPTDRPDVYQRAEAAFDQAARYTVQPAQYAAPLSPPSAYPGPTAPAPAPNGNVAFPATPAPGTLPPPGGTLAAPPGLGQPVVEPIMSPPPISGAQKRFQVGPRSNTPINFKSFPGNVPDQTVTVFSNGLRAVIEGLEAPRLGPIGRVVIETDRLVYWGPKFSSSLSLSGGETAGGPDIPIEIYMEGNIVFRQGDRLIYADRMYYNATYEYGVVLAAEVFTPVPNYQGLVRLKADVLRQMDKQTFRAQGAAITTSQLGVPSYWLQAEQIEFRDNPQPVVNPLTGQMVSDPLTNEVAVEHDMLARSRNNFVYVGGWPVFYWPVMATNLRKPNYYLERLSIKSDNVFGTQVLADWDLFQLLRIDDPPAGTQWLLGTDYLSERGVGLGTTFSYQQQSFLGHPGPVNGWLDAWGIHDTGLDDLGQNRRAVEPDTDWRGRVYWRHRQDLANGWQFTAQLGLISDRNFLEQYFEGEWDDWKDKVTSLRLKRSWDGQSLGILGQAHLNPSVSQTEWFPRLDHFLVGRSLLQDRLTWYGHSQASYARFRVLEPPTDPQDATGWAVLPWEQPPLQPEGGRFATRQELDLPLQLGGVKVVPYALGELAHWQEVLNNRQDVSRAFGQAGVRVSLPFWRSDPTVQSLLLNLNGMAHKVTLQADMFWSDASEDITEFPLYDPLDDDSQEHFRRYLGAFPWVYDPRNFAFRSGIQSWVSSPTLEMVDDLTAARLGIHQRWQTKRGLPGRQRVIDWIVLDVDGMLYPNADRDNFGEYFGQLEYDFRWHVGDRVTILSDGYTDLFPGAFRRVSLGSALSRPQRGQLYGGVVSMEGPFTSTLLVGSVSYRLSQKWITELSATYDLGPTGSIGERFGITRVGESALVRISVHADHGRDNLGASITVEPRFLPNGRLGRLAGVPIAPVGALGLE